MVAPAKDEIPFSCLLERLDYDLFSVVDFVHDQAKLAAIGLQHHDVDGLFRSLAAIAVELQFLVEIDDRQQVSAKAIDGDFLDFFDAHLRCLAFKPHQFHQAHLRDREALAAGRNDEGGNNREGERES